MIIQEIIKYFLIICIFIPSRGQFRDDTPQYKELMEMAKADLQESIMSHPDANLYFHPDRRLAYADNYRYNYPLSEDYRLGIIVDPCRSLAYNCCMNVFGTPEYPSLRITGQQEERVVKTVVIGDEEEVAVNYDLVYEDSSAVPVTARRWADDESKLDLNCIAKGKPYTYCMGKNYAFKRAPQRPSCTDNNASFDVLGGCFYPNGTAGNSCLQVAYSQSAFIALCETDDSHCGTYLEIHQSQGSPYQLERDIISEVKLETRNVSGFYTTVLPMTWMKNDTRVLCSYTESFLRIGSMVYILNSAPVCCCAKPFKPNTRVGSFQCPIGPTGGGAFAVNYRTTADIIYVDSLSMQYPFCPNGLDTGDRMMCSVFDFHDQRHYVRDCPKVVKTSPAVPRSWTSIDLDGQEYDGVCPYFDSCALTLDAGKCKKEDLKFTFIGQVGRVTALDNRAAIPQVWVTFNDGRTSYQFAQEQVQLETSKSMYEIWWVVRTKKDFVVQKKKGFNITSPMCTFDYTNDRYFPYTELT